jgi:hypothetical protein
MPIHRRSPVKNLASGAAKSAEKLSPLLQLEYRAPNDAFAQSGKPDQVWVGGFFWGFSDTCMKSDEPVKVAGQA